MAKKINFRSSFGRKITIDERALKSPAITFVKMNTIKSIDREAKIIVSKYKKAFKELSKY